MENRPIKSRNPDQSRDKRYEQTAENKNSRTSVQENNFMFLRMSTPSNNNFDLTRS